MVRLSEKQGEEFIKTMCKKDPRVQALEQQIRREKKMADMEKIQYYSADLSYALDIGEIADMWVETVNGTQVLRMTVLPKKHDEFKTVRVAPHAQTKKTVQRKQTSSSGFKGPVTRAPIIDADKPMNIGDKLTGAAKSWMQKKDKPQFMKDAGF
jgi:hypothetical protein